ncbi:MAG: hypothetical protein D6790_02255 [Caldilineae bacterium]|nr:MAG: hypothetical protein D6790_02255 [Caldilineae bacterium]
MSDNQKWNKLGSKRGVDTIFRVAYRTQVDLTGIADSKANIMISINGIILSVILATIVPILSQQRWLVLPTVVLLVTSVATLVFAVLAALPRVTKRDLTLEDVLENQVNILFFGHFTNLSKEEFEEGMLDLLHDRRLVYGTMIRDLYNAGRVLRRKFFLLRISYLIFLFGIVTSIALYIGLFLSQG